MCSIVDGFTYVIYVIQVCSKLFILHILISFFYLCFLFTIGIILKDIPRFVITLAANTTHLGWGNTAILAMIASSLSLLFGLFSKVLQYIITGCDTTTTVSPLASHSTPTRISPNADIVYVRSVQLAEMKKPDVTKNPFVTMIVDR
jgi:hypothetical protein